MLNASKGLKKLKNMLLLYIGDSMVSRMEKYYKNVADVKQRSQKNRDLYPYSIYCFLIKKEGTYLITFPPMA